MKVIFTCFALFFSFLTLAQRKLLNQLELNRIIINTPDSTIFAETLNSKKKIKIYDSKWYYWYKSDKIRITRGGYDGRLLSGDYKQFYHNHNLQSKGKFKKGLKSGRWKIWFANGELKEATYWRKGYKSGRFVQFDSTGFLRKKGKYKADKFNGKIYTYETDGSFQVTNESVKKRSKKVVNVKPQKKDKKNIFQTLFQRKNKPEQLNSKEIN
ncbi:MAG: hypothetical protein H7Z76_03520 [Methylotenera sp.]|nr:hypothetical protein [Flavobacterium sp.]